MKYFFFITTFFCLFSRPLFCQNDFKWAEPGAIWHFGTSLYGFNSGFARIWYETDTVLLGKQCQKLISHNIERMPSQIPNNYIHSLWKANYFVYKNEDSVFIYNSNINEFQLAFKTNGYIGEVWDLGIKSYYDSLKTYVKVDTIFYKEYNNENLRFIKLVPCDSLGNLIDMDDYLNFQGMIIDLDLVCEKFGPMSSFSSTLYSYPNYEMNCGIPPNFLCYDSEAFYPVNSSSMGCTNGIIVSTENFESNLNVEIFPNPAVNRNLLIQWAPSNTSKKANIRLLDSHGKMIKTIRETIDTSNSQLNLEEFPAGVYYIQIEAGSKVFSKKLILQ